MALLDIVNEMAEKGGHGSKSCPGQIMGVVLGIVAENYNKDLPGRLKVKLPILDEGADTLRWAKLAVPYGGKAWGQYFMPEKNDQVLVAFEHGRTDMPYVMASVYRDQDEIPSGAADQDNQKKKIVTKHGNSLIFEDHKEGGGEKDKIQILTAGETHMLTLDNENKAILLSDKEKNCVIEMKTKDGLISIKAAKKIVMGAGDSVKITMNGESKTLELTADKIRLKASQSLELESDGTAKLDGQQTTIKAAGTLKASSSGMVSVEGTPIKLG